MGITKLAVRFAVPLPQISSFHRYLFIGPHPDDIEIGAGATAAKLVAEGKQVCFLICTDGRYGDEFSNGVMGSDLAELRRKEAIASAALLGIEDVRFLNLCDGAGYSEESLYHGIARVFSDFRPDLIFAPDPDTGSECHLDHLRTGNAAKALACFAPYPGIMAQYGCREADVQALALYMTAKPNRFVKTRETFENQLQAIFDCHKSQYPADSPASNALKLYLKLRSVDFGLRCGCTCAEGFRVLGKTHMHCLPESGR